jgi:kynurenine formamidase
MRRLAVAAIGVLVGIAWAGAFAHRATGQTTASHHTVTKAEFEKWKTELSNWGRWGADDELGALNLITPAKRKQAAALVKEGYSVSMAITSDLPKAVDNPNPYEHTMTSAGPNGASDRISVSFHGFSVTHLDAFAHRMFDGRMWNGLSHELITKEKGAARNSIFNFRNGVFTRGILVDLPRLRGVEYLELGTHIYPEDLDAWAKKAGIKYLPGDALFIRTGRWTRRAKLGPPSESPMGTAEGLDPLVIPWLKKHDIALLGGESGNASPPGGDLGSNSVHDFAGIMLGVVMLDSVNLDAVAEAAAARKRWEFLFTAAPLPVVGGTGSPVNPIATF